MATDKEVEIFRNLVGKGVSKEKAKQVVLEIRKRQGIKEEFPTETTIPTEPVITESASPTIDLGLDKPMTPVEPEESGFLDRFKEGALATPLHDILSQSLTTGGEPLVEKGQEIMQEAKSQKAPADAGKVAENFMDFVGNKIFTAETGADISANFWPDMKESGGEIMTLLGDIPGAIKGIATSAKAVTKGGLDQKFEGTFLEGVFDPAKTDKEIQDSLIGALQDIFVNKETGEFKHELELSNDVLETVRENPFVFTMGIPKLFLSMRRGGKGQLKKAAELNEEAKDLVTKAIHATGKENKLKAESIAQEVLDKGLTGTPEDLIAKSYNELNKLYPELNRIKSELGGEIDVDQLLKMITDFEDTITSPQGGRLPSMKLEGKDLDLLTDDLFEYIDNNGKISEQLGLNLRDFLRKDYKVGEISNDIQELRQAMGNNIAKQLNEGNIDLDKINSQVHFYTTLKDLLEETKLRKSSQPGGVDTTKNASLRLLSGAIGTGIVGMLGGSQIAGTIIGLYGGDKLIGIVNSPKYKLASAQKKKKVADALLRGDKKSFEQALDAIIISQGIGTDEEIQEALNRVDLEEDKGPSESSRFNLLNIQ